MTKLSNRTATFPLPTRVQFVNADDDRVIQIQDTRFLYNWRKRESVYPRFKEIYPEFRSRLERFREFLRAASLGDVALNQCEITYVNHIPNGELWEKPPDWHTILPGLMPASTNRAGTRLESASGEMHFEIEPEKGRLHVSIRSGRLPEGGGELLELHLTARGRVDPDDPAGQLKADFELGRAKK